LKPRNINLKNPISTFTPYSDDFQHFLAKLLDECRIGEDIDKHPKQGRNGVGSCDPRRADFRLGGFGFRDRVTTVEKKAFFEEQGGVG
jgi:hypothetical protein